LLHLGLSRRCFFTPPEVDKEIPVEELPMSRINFRNGLRDHKLAVTALIATALALTCGTPAMAQGATEGDVALPQTRRDAARELAMKITEPFTFAAVGDIIIHRPIGQLGDAGFQTLTKVMRAADSTYANMEGPIIDESDADYHGPPAGGPKTIIDDLKAMGIRVMTTANNHTMDGGTEGMFTTNRLLDEARITHAGSGKDLTAARRAEVGITPKGTIGVVGMYSIDPSSYPGRTRYTDARDKWPGLNPLHVTPYNIVTAEHMAALRQIRDASYAHRSEVTVPVAPLAANESPNELILFGTRYKVGENVGGLAYTIDQRDLDGIMRSIRVGKQNSDFMVVAIHAHQNSFSYQAYSHDNSTPDFLIELAHKAIDNGADIFVGHGVHTLRGVEIYKGKPIFYGVASFVQHEGPAIEVTDSSRSPEAQQSRQPDNKEVLLTASRYEGGKLVEVRLYPVDCGIDGTRPVSKAGVPMSPSPEQARRILKHVQDLSRPFGTTISIEDNVGVIHVAQSGTEH
jgi:poly-gamma-glutamate capsule biosynthesis protein CapA/YwtB (metallophosphatase superfamily)